MNDPEVVTPPHGMPVPSAQPEPAEYRRSPNMPDVPIPPPRSLLEPPDDSLRHAFLRARQLFRESRRENIDAATYLQLKPHLISLCRYWTVLAKEQPENEELAELLREVRSYLPRHYRYPETLD